MIKVSVPGSVMITGEHAVVYGSRAIVAAVEQRLTLHLRPREDRRVSIHSEIAAPFEGDLDQLTAEGDYKFVLAALVMHRDTMPGGCDISVTSQINPTLGLGSSAAVTVASVAALARYCGQPLNETVALHRKAHQIVLSIQGRGSGADLAASLMGGMIAYRAPEAVEITPLPAPAALALRYCGYKTPTAVVLQKIAVQMQGHEARFDRIYADMGRLADQAIAASEAQDWPAFGGALTGYQTLMEELGVSDDTLDQIITDARNETALLAAKISGSGLGDCVLAVSDQPGYAPAGFTPAILANQGLILHD